MKAESDKINLRKLHYIGEGTYGKIYELSDKKRVIKVHDEKGPDSIKCKDWKKEYQIHQYILKHCRNALQGYSVDIPNVYDYQTTKMGEGELQKVRKSDTSVSADSCYYTMDRIPNRTGSDTNYDRILGQIVIDATKVGIDERPPYLYLGSISPVGPAITLDMVRGVRLQNTLGDRFNFAHVESGSVAFQLQKNMVDGFFILTGCGVVPRDIEYALAIDTVKGTVKTIIYDFNQCDFAVERRKRAFSVDSYNYSMDLAEIYIDLCGLRHPNDSLGNRLVLDTPTPQWKFLCNPLVSPGSWCEIMEGLLVGGGMGMKVDMEGFIRYTLEYLIKYYGGGDKGIHMPWKSQSGYFYKGNNELLRICDHVIQEILLFPVWKDCHHGKKWKGGLSGKFIDLYSEGCVAISTYTSTYTVEDDWDLGHVFRKGIGGGARRNTRKKKKGGEKLANHE
jgi:hypothetical protein